MERLIGSVRRECLDYTIVLGESYLRKIMAAYKAYYNEARTHLSLSKDTPLGRPIERIGRIIARPMMRRPASPIRPNLVFGRRSYRNSVISTILLMD
jgi:hypothetical protein